MLCWLLILAAAAVVEYINGCIENNHHQTRDGKEKGKDIKVMDGWMISRSSLGDIAEQRHTISIL